MSTENLWKFSSLLDYLGKRRDALCHKEAIIGQFQDEKDYEKFMLSNALHLRKKKELDEELE